MQEEVWRPIKGFEGLYEVSNQGRVRSLVGRWGEGRVLKPYKSKKKGYLSVTLTGRDATGKVFSSVRLVHILVADAFLPEDAHRPVIDHINCDRCDNRVENLRRCTYKENNANPITLERKAIGIARACTTEEFRRKCSEAANPRKVRVRCIETGEIYESFVAAGKATGLNPATIQGSCARSTARSLITNSNGKPVLHFERVSPKQQTQPKTRKETPT